MTNEEAAWLAGILEGEACFDFADSAKKFPRIRISMTDKDVIQRVKSLCQTDTSIRTAQRNDWKEIYCFSVTKKEDLRRVITAIEPWMSVRRTAKIVELKSRL